MNMHRNLLLYSTGQRLECFLRQLAAEKEAVAMMQSMLRDTTDTVQTT